MRGIKTSLADCMSRVTNENGVVGEIEEELPSLATEENKVGTEKLED